MMTYAPRASALRDAKLMRIHDNILRTRCMNVIVIRLHVFLRLILAPPPKRSAGQAGVKGAKCTILQKSGFYTKKSLKNRNNQDSAITYYVKLLVVMYLHWCF